MNNNNQHRAAPAHGGATLAAVLSKLAGAAALLAGATGAGAAGFTGPADPSAFTIANVGTLVGGSPSPGFAVFAANQLVMVGADAISPDPAMSAPACTGGVYGVLASPCQLQVTLAGAPGTYGFSWSYVSVDDDGPAGDIFGVVVDGRRIALSDPGGAVAQAGIASFAANTSFGWFINCTDCTGGLANATVSGFVLTPIPEPTSWAMLLAGGAVVAALRRRRQPTHG